MMRGDELRAIRTELGISQSEMAQQLGLTQTFMGLMERNEKPIEARTALAARQVFNEHTPLYGWRTVEPLDTDVSLEKAQIIWEPDDSNLPPVKVIAIPGDDDERYRCSYGACNSDWAHADRVGRLLRLFSRFHELTVAYGISPLAVHEAFCVIPEYRESVSMGTLQNIR